MIFILLGKQPIIMKKDNFTVKLSFEFCTAYLIVFFLVFYSFSNVNTSLTGGIYECVLPWIKSIFFGDFTLL